MTGPSRRLPTLLKTYAVLLLFLAMNAGGNTATAWGMKHVPEKMSMDPSLYLHAMLNPFVALGIAALIVALLTRMALLSLADLRFVLPVTSLDRQVVPARNNYPPAVARHGLDLCGRGAGRNHVG